MAKTSYAVALGSNRPHGRYGSPAKVVAAAIEVLRRHGLSVKRISSIRSTAALGPAGRSFANAAVIVATNLSPADFLALLKTIERSFGRRRGRRWGPRVLDLDIILWSKGRWRSERLTIPHPGLPDRAFVLDPLSEIAPEWRAPKSGLTVGQLRFRQRMPKPRPQSNRHTRIGAG